MASKSKRRRKVLGASCILAALIIAGSSFAWFTSKDEVTNRLSASANYGVSIAEDFQPPAEWLPGQTVNKDVAAVNTGNVDAFVRMWMDGQMRLVKEAAPSVDAKGATATSGLTLTTDAKMSALDLNYSKTTAGEITYYKTLSTDKINNPNDLANQTVGTEENNSPAGFSDVQTIQAGGVLVYAPTNAEYYWTLEQATELPVYTPATGTSGDPGYVPAKTEMTNLAKGTIVGSSGTTQTLDATPAAVTSLAPASGSDNNYYGSIDASTFQPKTTGLYIFRRDVVNTEDGTANNYEYSGYYYDSTLKKYFALHTGTDVNGKSEYVLPDGAVTENDTAVPTLDQVLPVTVDDSKVYLFTATETVVNTAASGDTNLVWTYDGTNSKFTVHYEGGADVVGGWNDDIDITVNLANLGNGSEQWTAKGTGSLTTFYYNNDLESGDTSTKLVDSIVLSSSTQKEAYLAFDFDLNVYLESQQVAIDDADGKEITTPVTQWAATQYNSAAVNTGANAGTPTYGSAPNTSEINNVNWADYS